MTRTFNSLSRDHFKLIYKDVNDEETVYDAFNSLSRDHPRSSAVLMRSRRLSRASNFQLPLSGSPDGGGAEGGRNFRLSTPSLGITVTY